MRKIYAVQIPPECQEGPFYLFDEAPEGVTVTGNRDFKGFTTKEFDCIKDNLEDCLEQIDDLKTNPDDSWYDSEEDIIFDLLPPVHKDEYTAEENAKFKEIFVRYEKDVLDNRVYGAEQDIKCELMELMTGKPYSCGTLRGCCQSDWQDCYYPTDSGFDPRTFEVEYFNTGTEWMIHEGDEAPATPQDIEGYIFYCVTYDPVKEIAENEGVEEKDVVLYEFDGYTQTAKYKMVEAG